MDTRCRGGNSPLSIYQDTDIKEEKNGKRKFWKSFEVEESSPTLAVLTNSLKKAYMLLDSLHGPKETDINMLSELGRTGLSHQLVLTKLDRAPATLWTELGAALRQNPVRLAPHKSATLTLPTSKSKDTLAMGVWAPLRGQLALGCDETILGISSVEEWGIAELRCSILKACGLFREQNFDDDNYVNALKEVPVIEDGSEEDAEDDIEPGGPKFEDDNPMRGKVFGGKETFRKKIHRW